jgi:hypothetical protein
MQIFVFLIVGLSILSFSSQAEESISMLKTSEQPEVGMLTNPINGDIPPVIVVAEEPKSLSIQEALAAPDDSYVEGKDLNEDGEESPDEADEDGEEDEDGENEDNADAEE